MKKILLIALLLTPFLGIAQTTKPIDGFSGVKFGSSKIAVITAMKAKGATLDKQNSEGDNLAFSDAKLGFRKTVACMIKFVNNKAFEADYIFAPEVEAKIFVDYKDLVDDLTRAYGEGQSTKNYKDPYKEGEEESDTLLGFSSGQVDFHTVWFAANKNSVSVTVSTNMTLLLQYQDHVLVNEAIAKQNAAQKSDL